VEGSSGLFPSALTVTRHHHRLRDFSREHEKELLM
jgi:hypothetical protein